MVKKTLLKKKQTLLRAAHYYFPPNLYNIDNKITIAEKQFQKYKEASFKSVAYEIFQYLAFYILIKSYLHKIFKTAKFH